MKKIMRAFFGLIGIGLLALAVMPVTEHHAAASGSAPVMVTNTPLPVQGTVGVNNFPASQTVNGTVNVGNTPTVNLAPGSSFNVSNPQDSQSNPAPLITFDAAQPYQDSCNNLLSPGVNSYITCQMQNIPSDKRLVIQEVDYAIDIDSGQRPARVAIATRNVGGTYHYLPVTFAGKFGGGLDDFTGQLATRLYVDPTWPPTCSFFLDYTSVSGGNFYCAISGFLLDAN